MREIDIKGWEGLYTIAEDGTIRGHKGNVRKINKSGGSGYHQIQLHRDKKQTTYLYHRLLAEAFIPNPEGKRCVNHIDGNKHNNSLDNLEWATHSENTNHAWEIGLKTRKITKAGVLLAKDLIAAGMKRALVAKLMGISHSHLEYVNRRKMA